jgi:hypothetical protein
VGSEAGNGERRTRRSHISEPCERHATSTDDRTQNTLAEPYIAVLSVSAGYAAIVAVGELSRRVQGEKQLFVAEV